MLPTLIILASGRGERFVASGGVGNKLHAQLAGKSVLEHVVAAARASGLPWHLEDAGHAGMGDAIAAAVRAARGASGWLILPGDLPLIRSDTLRAVASALQRAEVVVPTFGGQRGHPVGFAAICGPALQALRGDRGAAGVVRSFTAIELPVDDAGCVTDIDTIGDLVRAGKLMG